MTRTRKTRPPTPSFLRLPTNPTVPTPFPAGSPPREIGKHLVRRHPASVLALGRPDTGCDCNGPTSARAPCEAPSQTAPRRVFRNRDGKNGQKDCLDSGFEPRRWPSFANSRFKAQSLQSFKPVSENHTSRPTLLHTHRDLSTALNGGPQTGFLCFLTPNLSAAMFECDTLISPHPPASRMNTMTIKSF